MQLNNMLLFIELSEGVAHLNNCVTKIEKCKQDARDIREKKKNLMEENKGLV